MKPTTTNVEAVKQKVQQAQALLEQQMKALQTSEDWRRTLETMATLGPTSINRFSFGNIVLLMAQDRNVRHAATFNSWMKKGRQVQKGAKGLTILRPRFVRSKKPDEEEKRLSGFSYMTVFGLSQTEGPPLEVVRPLDVETPEGFEWTVERLTRLVEKLPTVSSITLRFRRAGDTPGAQGWFEVASRRIVVLLGETSDASIVATLLHEVAHSILHGADQRHSTPVCEVEAESAAFVVAHALGLDTSRFAIPYVATWANAEQGADPLRMVQKTGERVRLAASIMLEVLFPADTSAAADAAEAA